MALPIFKDVARSLRCVVAAIFCVVALAVPARAFADTPSIAYDGNARQLTVSGATDSSGEPDLFPAFKDLMPGDVREQQIGVRATGVKSQVRVFVRAVVDHETAHLLSPITLTASAADASAGWLQTGTPGSVFAYPTQVATFTSDGSTVLNLQLSVPTSVGNELADANKAIRWEITAEDDGEKIPVQPAGSKKPGLLVFGLILGACALIIGLFAVGMAGPEVVSVDAGIWTVSLGIMTALVPVLLLIYVLMCLIASRKPSRRAVLTTFLIWILIIIGLGVSAVRESERGYEWYEIRTESYDPDMELPALPEPRSADTSLLRVDTPDGSVDLSAGEGRVKIAVEDKEDGEKVDIHVGSKGVKITATEPAAECDDFD